VRLPAGTGRKYRRERGASFATLGSRAPGEKRRACSKHAAVTALTVLALDTATPRVGVAVARDGVVLAIAQGGQQESSRHLLGWVDAALATSGLTLAALDGIVALGGPGSFTGLRVGLATALGFHQASGLPATTLPTLQVVAAGAPPGRQVLAVAPALPGEWFAQIWDSAWPPRPLAPPARVGAAELAALAGQLVVTADGWDLAAAASAAGRPGHLAVGLAAIAAQLASLHPTALDAARLSAPLYLAPAPAALPGAPKRVMPGTSGPSTELPGASPGRTSS
jgi:tRNA threonylcarbamoyladenosine biosynthesis protein TsaB